MEEGMDKINDGGPAFPTSNAQAEGMTLRDYFAAKAMGALVGTEMFTEGQLMDHEVAGHAYAMADAMLKAREAR